MSRLVLLCLLLLCCLTMLALPQTSYAQDAPTKTDVPFSSALTDPQVKLEDLELRMVPLTMDGFEKVKAGIVPVEEVLRTSQSQM